MKPEASPASIPTAKFPRSLNTLHEAMGEYVRVCVSVCMSMCVCVSQPAYPSIIHLLHHPLEKVCL